MVLQFVPSLLYSARAPVSMPLMLNGWFGWKLPPLSVATVRTGARATVSRVKLNAVELPERLPATSVWWTMTDLLPSPARVRLLPLPVVQVEPLSVLYCQLAPHSRTVTLTVTLLVM